MNQTKDDRWEIVIVKTSDGKLHEVWKWELNHYKLRQIHKENNTSLDNVYVCVVR